jgi:hypothetical protein
MNVQDAFADIEADNRWFSLGGLSQEELTAFEAEIGLGIPPQVRELLTYSRGGEWAGKRLVQFFERTSFRDVNTELQKWLPGAFAFASDGGSKWYLVDVSNRLGRGEGKVWSLPAAAPFASEARYVAEDIPAFVRWMVEGG